MLLNLAKINLIKIIMIVLSVCVSTNCLASSFSAMRGVILIWIYLAIIVCWFLVNVVLFNKKYFKEKSNYKRQLLLSNILFPSFLFLILVSFGFNITRLDFVSICGYVVGGYLLVNMLPYVQSPPRKKK